jgi:hypothetical protein
MRYQESIMSPRQFSPSHVSSSAAGRAKTAGAWALAPGRAMQLRPRETGRLQILCGRVWATTDAEHDSIARRFGDLVLQAGDSLTVAAGQRLVIEPLDGGDAGPVYFDWQELPVLAGAPRPAHWQAQVATPGRELWASLGQTGQALGRLGWGLAVYGGDTVRHWGGHFVAGRGRVLSRFESNQP